MTVVLGGETGIGIVVDRARASIDTDAEIQALAAQALVTDRSVRRPFVILLVRQSQRLAEHYRQRQNQAREYAGL